MGLGISHVGVLGVWRLELGFRVYCLGFVVLGLGFRAYGVGFVVLGLGFMAWGFVVLGLARALPHPL